MGTILAGQNPVEERPGNGVTFLLLDPTLLVSDDRLKQNLVELANYIKSSRPTKEGREVLLPGEPEQQTRVKRLRDGIDFEPSTWDAILAIAASLNVNTKLDGKPRSKMH
jgi:LDH2 family malate/lactate/ureidoglycolate dehydrogenase